MVRHEGGRWDVGSENDAVYLERISESDERLFDDLLSPQEARELAKLLTKYADKADEAEDADKSGESEDSGDRDSEHEPKDSEKSDDDEDGQKDGESKDSKDDDSDKSGD